MSLYFLDFFLGSRYAFSWFCGPLVLFGGMKKGSKEKRRSRTASKYNTYSKQEQII